MCSNEIQTNATTIPLLPDFEPSPAGWWHGSRGQIWGLHRPQVEHHQTRAMEGLVPAASPAVLSFIACSYLRSLQSMLINPCTCFLLLILFTDKLKASSESEQAKEEREVTKPSVPAAEPKLPPTTTVEKPGKKTEPVKIQKKDRKRYSSNSQRVIELFADNVQSPWSHGADSSPYFQLPKLHWKQLKLH